MHLSKLYGAGLAMVLLMSATVPMLAHAEITITAGDSKEVNLDSTQNADAHGNVMFHLVNPTSNAMNFVSPDLGVTGLEIVIPPKSERTYVMAQTEAGYENRKISYRFERHPDPLPLGPQYADWSRRLSDLIQAQKPDYNYFPQYKIN